MSSQMFELFFRLPQNKLTRPGLKSDVKFSDYEVDPDWSLDPNWEIEVCTNVRAFDAKSYHFCRLLVRERTFGFVNKSRFFFKNLHNGVEYVLDSKEVAEMCGTTKNEPYFKLVKVSARSAS